MRFTRFSIQDYGSIQKKHFIFTIVKKVSTQFIVQGSIYFTNLTIEQVIIKLEKNKKVSLVEA